MDKKLKILMLEDVATDAELIERELRKANIDFSSKRIETKEAFIRELKEFSPDLILSDYALPSFDGMSALKIVQEEYSYVPFIFVTGSLGEEKAIETLKSGATDYVLKERLSRLGAAVHRALCEAEERIQRKQAERKIQEQAALPNKTQDAIVVRDMEHNILFWNKGAERLYGWKAEEVVGKNAIDLFYKEISPQLAEAQKSIIEKGEWNGEMFHATKDGREVIVQSRWTLMYDEERIPKSILVINTDITDNNVTAMVETEIYG